MDGLIAFVNQINAVVWGPPMLLLLAGTGVFLTLGLRFIPQRKLGYGFKMLWKGRKSTEQGGNDCKTEGAKFEFVQGGEPAQRCGTRVVAPHDGLQDTGAAGWRQVGGATNRNCGKSGSPGL